jgi:hypothetical protein
MQLGAAFESDHVEVHIMLGEDAGASADLGDGEVEIDGCGLADVQGFG